MKFVNDIEIVEYNTADTECIAVIGCLKTDKGMRILNELLSWVPKNFILTLFIKIHQESYLSILR